MIKKTLSILIVLALSGNLPTAIADAKNNSDKFYYPTTLDLSPLRLHSPESNPYGPIMVTMVLSSFEWLGMVLEHTVHTMVEVVQVVVSSVLNR